MPTKTYRCENCEFVFDNIQRFDEPNPSVCPNCQHQYTLLRVYKPVGVVFKGSGFYATDNKNSSRVTAPNGSKPSANGSESKDAVGEDKSSGKEKTPKTEKTSKTTEKS